MEGVGGAASVGGGEGEWLGVGCCSKEGRVGIRGVELRSATAPSEQ